MTAEYWVELSWKLLLVLCAVSNVLLIGIKDHILNDPCADFLLEYFVGVYKPQVRAFPARSPDKFYIYDLLIL